MIAAIRKLLRRMPTLDGRLTSPLPGPRPTHILIRPDNPGTVIGRLIFEFGSATRDQQYAAAYALTSLVLPATSGQSWFVRPGFSADPVNAPWSECYVKVSMQGDWEVEAELAIGILTAATRNVVAPHGKITIEHVRSMP